MSAEQRRAAAQDGHEHFQMQQGEPTAALCNECRPRVANDIGQLKRRPSHGGRSGCGFASELRQLVKRIDQILHMSVGEVDVPDRLFEITMSGQLLNGADVRSGIEQVSGETVPQRLPILLMICSQEKSAIAFILSMT